MLGQATEKASLFRPSRASASDPNIQTIFELTSVFRLTLRVVKVGRQVVGDEALEVLQGQGRRQHCQRLEGRAVPHRGPVEAGVFRQAAQLAERARSSLQRRLLAGTDQSFSPPCAV